MAGEGKHSANNVEARKKAQESANTASAPDVTSVISPSESSYAPKATYTSSASKRKSSRANASSSPYTSAADAAAKNRKSSNRRIGLIVLAIFVALLVALYAAGVVVFSSRFYPSTTMGTFDLSLKTFEEAATLIEDAEADYTLDVEGQGLEFTLTAEDVGMTVDAEALVESAAGDMSPFLWFVNIWGTHDLAEYLAASVDDEALLACVTTEVEAYNAEATPSEDASISYSSDAGAFVIISEVYGDQISADAVAAAITEAISTMSTTCSLEEDVVITPSVLSDDENLASGLSAANELIACNATFVAEGTDITLVELGPDTVSEWVVFADDYTPSIDSDALAAWAAEIADKYDTVGSTRTYTRPDGKEVTVSGGDYGWTVDADAFATAVADAVSAGTEGTIEVTCSETGNGYTAEGQDWGAYVDIDITEQCAYYYDETGELLWWSYIITGDPTEGNDTPTGVYSINALVEDTYLRGPLDDDGEYEWESHVDYWMPFVDYLIGLHDASWQADSAWGDATAYTYTGSHGCVNVQPSKAGALFELLEIGTTVVVHE